ncbi:MAG: hypothetical protein A2977_02655 [Alphaproteobacteria bacterium RIFCSPLOWO2_01_FULL_45_8]|nr:MAG: hypothetical protein A2065_01555 [Alphaproteobacteria bacterium GWB1_45_5]OFW89505.1 MAG: hypothetical protein A2621_01090 [Alphaproteobacteria bacterium RIFCSPHIGHO2_01_FULL_41_14]OFW95630.1 MAG: hypothetical protein A2977_02655 [Alphaproteobacteria bacterium RIFCSPLOWO2_01_FULL_45_8]
MKLTQNKFVNPLNMFLAVVLGICVGVFFPFLTRSVEGVNGVLSNLLTMCVIPIVVSSLIVEIGSFLRSTQRSSMKKFALISVAAGLGLSLFSAGMGVLFQPGKHISFDKKSDLSSKVLEEAIIERAPNQPIETLRQENFFDFFEKAVPKNIFGAFTDNKTFQIILFTIIFAISLSHCPKAPVLENFFEATRDAFLKIFSYGLFFLPVLVFTSTSLSISKIGLYVFLDMLPFLQIIFLQFVLVFLGNLLILRYRLKIPILSILKDLQNPALIAFSGSTLAATIPTLSFFKNTGEKGQQFMTIVTPIAMFLNQYGSIIYFSFSCFFIAQVYGHPFSFEEALFIIVISVVGGMAVGANDGIRGVLLISILDPVHVSAGQLVLILAGLDFLVSPFISMITVQTNITILSFLSEQRKRAILTT